ncbi:hypothetical protein DPMN_176177 [Dreissena polymorpha]|uniref:Uncharacterized protein n=1 Tax=Dreissena polymorpha TaxID=45954 RepID=A0A9D4IIX6_DREPO|nr:hypothetical protein DPMN_176177 [Dreissena polymorpha]
MLDKVIVVGKTFWENNRTISLISHLSKVMLRIILNRLKSKEEELIAKYKAGLRA